MNKIFKRSWKINSLILFYSILFCLMYRYHTIDIYKFKDLKYKWVLKMTQSEAKAYLGTGWSIPERNTVFPIHNKAEITLYLPVRDAFSLRLKIKTNGVKNFEALKLFFNRHQIFTFYKKIKGETAKLYFKIPKIYTQIGENKLEFIFPEDWIGQVKISSIKLRNYLGFNFHFPQGAILFDDSLCVKPIYFLNWKTLIGTLFLFLGIHLFLFWGSDFISELTKINFKLVYRKGLFSFAPGVILFAPMSLFSLLTPYHLVTDTISFIFIMLGTTLITWGILLSIKIILPKIFPEKPKLSKFSNHLKSSKTYIIGSMILLILCAFFLVFEQEKGAEQLAVIAYFFLVIGVGIEFYNLIKFKDENKKDT